MRLFQFCISTLTCFAVLTACSPQSATPTETAKESPTAIVEATLIETELPPSAVKFAPGSTQDFPAAISISLISAGDTVYMIVGREESLYVSRSTDGGQSFSESVSASGHHSVHLLRIERPAIAANEKGEVVVAWLEPDPNGGYNRVWYANSSDGAQSFGAAKLVSVEAPGEIAMVEVALDGDGNPLLAWLSGQDLRFARSTDRGQTFLPAKSIGDGACECCHLDIIVTGEKLLIGYRGLGEDERGAFRDAALIRSTDRGDTFGPVTFATDSHWYINACPVSGPSLAMKEEDIYMTWMDGRALAPDNLMSSDVWFAASSDGGQSFSPNLKVSGESSTHNFVPVMVVSPSGRIHMAWQAISVAAIYYAISDDGGHTFTTPQVIADDRLAEQGPPASPTIAIDGQGRIYLAWLDDAGLRLAIWKDSE